VQKDAVCSFDVRGRNIVTLRKGISKFRTLAGISKETLHCALKDDPSDMPSSYRVLPLRQDLKSVL
ncbi:hypothetical protein STEG23_036413, partial [Scotinomys teguina]